ncbi:MAG: Xaa-Pro peptidase family protein [Thermoanaerobaculia bacterium]|nr:Xaa-Pro peptidase family protein [Thermoanaerobaculia bacterium]
MRPLVSVLLIVLASVLVPTFARAERFAYPPEEFVERRTELCDAIDEPATVVLFSSTRFLTGLRFRQDHDFYYLTGNEDLNGALALDTESCDAWLFLPSQTVREASRDGWNWLYREDAAKRWGFEEIRPMTYFDEFLARRRVSGEQVLYVRLSERDEMDGARLDTAIFTGRRMANPWGAQPTLDAWRARMFRQRYPYYELRDVAPRLDAMRMIKRPREIEALRRNGRISAHAVQAAIEATAPGRYEYEIEAEATYTMIREGAEHAAYAAIAGSGPNVTIWHYNANDRRMEAGDLVVMDYGASVGYQTMDITRTWPVSGRFTELQERAYRAVLEAQKAVIAALGPGVERSATHEIAKRIVRRWGFDDRYAHGAGHFVGMGVHDVGDYSSPLRAGMVIAVEPIVEIPEEEIHVRIEDTVLITPDGAEVLSSAVPKEIDDLLPLVGRSVQGERR